MLRFDSAKAERIFANYFISNNGNVVNVVISKPTADNCLLDYNMNEDEWTYKGVTAKSIQGLLDRLMHADRVFVEDLIKEEIKGCGVFETVETICVG